jgi:hypothetical protein
MSLSKCSKVAEDGAVNFRSAVGFLRVAIRRAICDADRTTLTTLAPPCRIACETDEVAEEIRRTSYPPSAFRSDWERNFPR